MELSGEAKRRFRLQDYTPKPSIQGVEVVELHRHTDDGGSFTELGRFTAGVSAAFGGFALAQVNYSELEPGAIKAFHLHRRQTDVWFVPPGDKILLGLVDVRAGSPTEGVRIRLVLGDGQSRLVRIPPGVAHGCRNLAPMRGRIVYFTDTHFAPAPEASDEGRLSWDFAGADLWEIARE
ncbi:MAG: dTDP-4-dehydrorhamnose 3,5-epimerase family protein [Candidatus Rokubacteria bacterium]|nr:dTDP-4-dehydrorhamnose 3,5-epimerase family protein [Candidatus Rokubacteria bacterium]